MVLGFIFNIFGDVILIKKERPLFQKGLIILM